MASATTVSPMSGSTRFFRMDLRRENLLQGEFATFIVKLLEAVEAVAAVAHHLAGLADIAEPFGQFEHADFGANDFLVLWS